MCTPLQNGKLPLPDGIWLCRLAATVALGLLIAGRLAAWAEPNEGLEKREISLEAGELKNYDLPIGSALVEGVVYRAVLEKRSWEDGQLRFGFFNPSAPTEPLDGDSVAEVQQEKEEVLHLRVISERCCPSLNGEVRIFLEPQGSRSGKQPKTISLPFRVDGKFEECGRRKIESAVHATLVATLVLYLHSIFANSHFLSSSDLALRLKPLVRNGKSPPVDDKERQDVEQMVDRKLRFWPRAWNWLRANPLAFGLPGRAYHETARLALDSRLDGSDLTLVPHRNLYRLLERKPDLGSGGVFVAAWGKDLRFFGVPQGDSFNGLQLRRLAREPRGKEPQKVDLHRDRLLYRTGFEGRRVGWEI